GGVIDPYMDDGSNNPPPLNFKDEETPPTYPVIPDANDFIKCSPITFHGNERAVGLIRWIEKSKMVFTVSKCTEANKVVFAAATFQDRVLTWWNLQVATLGKEAVTRKPWAKMKKEKLIIRRGSGRTSKEAVVVVVEIAIGNVRAMTNVGNQNINEAG
nr:hypothetical protein [Tanacetum cinerariifolium]